MAVYEFDFEAETLDTFPSWMTRRWSTASSSPLVKSAASGGWSGLTKALTCTRASGTSRALATFNAIDADGDRATVKTRAIVYTGSTVTDSSAVWASVLRASGSAGNETGYVNNMRHHTTNGREISPLAYKSSTATTDGNQNSPNWADNTWYVVETDISGTTTTTIDIRVYAINNLDTPIITTQRVDTTSPITAAGWIGIGDFSPIFESSPSQISLIQVATGADNLPALTVPDAVMGVNLILHDRATKSLRINQTGIKYRYWDSPTATGVPLLEASNGTTNGSGVFLLNVDSVTAHSVGNLGYLDLYKSGATKDDDLNFSGRVLISDIS